MSVEEQEIKGLMKAIAPVISEFVLKVVEPLQDRIKQLEAKRALDYRGVWKSGQAYNKGNFVTHQGSLWHANEANAARPGDGSTAWTLAIKRGRMQE